LEKNIMDESEQAKNFLVRVPRDLWREAIQLQRQRMAESGDTKGHSLHQIILDALTEYCSTHNKAGAQT
jgi:hypothetical protein